jgi:hypothetical protein
VIANDIFDLLQERQVSSDSSTCINGLNIVRILNRLSREGVMRYDDADDDDWNRDAGSEPEEGLPAELT